MNGTYKGAQGPNIADVNSGTESINLGCTVGDSRADTAESASDACIRTTDGNIFVKDCTLSGAHFGLVNVNGTLTDLGGNVNTTAGGTSGTIS